MTRRHFRLLSRILICALLYGQMAVAAHACPQLVSAATTDVSIATMMADTNGEMNEAPASAMSGDCAGMQGSMDPSAPKLCADHCNYGHQSDQSPNLTVPTALLTPLYVAQPMRLPSVPSQPAADLSALAEASPPLAILHCCFRI